MLQRLLMVVSIGAALGVLAVLIIRTQGAPQSLEGHLARMTALAQTSAANAEADTEITRARLRLDSDTEGLTDASGRLEAARNALALHRDGMRAVSREVSGSTSALLQQIDDKQALLGPYRGLVGEFADSYAKLVRQGDAALADPAVAASPASGSLRRLLEEITTYSLQSSPGNRGEIDSLLGRLSTEGVRNPALRGRLQAVESAAGSVLRDRDQIREMAAKLREVPVTETLGKLQKNYVSHYAKAEGNLERYRLVLVIYAAALLSVFGVVGWRLRRTYGELDRSHAELQDLNTHLEDTVQERTGELRQALSDLRFQQAQLVQSEKMAALGQMVAGVAHEINTPLGYVRGNVQTVGESLPLIAELIGALQSGDEQQREEALRRWPPAEGLEEMAMLLTDAEYGLGEISGLVMGLKDFSRVDRSQSESVSLNDGIDTSLKICQGQLKNRVEVRKDYGELPLVPCAPSQINQVFLNLLTNAGQAIEGEGHIDIKTYATDNDAVIEIRDSGCGMDKDTLAHIFEPFFTTKPVGQGTGLGLSIVFKIIETHKGRIEVESEPGQGTMFRVSLPLRVQTIPATPASPVAETGDDFMPQGAYA